MNNCSRTFQHLKSLKKLATLTCCKMSSALPSTGNHHDMKDKVAQCRPHTVKYDCHKAENW